MTTTNKSSQLQTALPSQALLGILQQLPSALLLVHPQTHAILLSNQRAQAILGLSQQGAYPTVADWPERLAPLKALFSQAWQGDLLRKELTLPALEGQGAEQTLGYSLRLEEMAGLGPALSFVFSDITQVLQARQAAEIMKAELYQAKKMAAMGSLIAGVAHQLNNPLIGIYMGADLARRSLEQTLKQSAQNASKAVLPEPPIEKPIEQQLGLLSLEIERIIAATLHANTLVKDLVNYARPAKLNLEFIEWQPFVSQRINQWQTTWLDPAKATVTIEPFDGLGWVKADPFKLEQILFQVLKNAVEAGLTLAPAPVAIKLYWSEPVAKAGQPPLLALHITDNGVGMAAETMERVFEPFFTTKGAEHTGLGLSLAYVTAEQHGGQLSVASTLGQGTTVTLSLPSLMDED